MQILRRKQIKNHFVPQKRSGVRNRCIKIISFIFLVSFVLQCHRYTYFFAQPKPLSNEDISGKDLNKKIGLVGFCKFFYPIHRDNFENDLNFIKAFYKKKPSMFEEVTIKADSFGAPFVFEARVCGEDWKQKIKIGNDVKQILFTELDLQIERSKINNFVETYLSEVKRSGQTELSAMIKFINGKPLVPKRDIDYYIIGVFSPPIRKSTNLGLFARFTTLLISVPTLYTVPYLDRDYTDSKFYIYDNKLNFIRAFDYRNEYWNISAWWLNQLSPSINLSDSNLEKREFPYYPPFFHEPELIKFENDVREFFSEAK